MIIAKVLCKCGRWIRIRTRENEDSARCWNCGRPVFIKRQGGRGARITGKCETETRRVYVEYEE